MKLRAKADAILVGINTILADDPSLTVRSPSGATRKNAKLRRIILDSRARTPLAAKVVSDEFTPLTTIVTTERAPRRRVEALAKRVRILTAPTIDNRPDLSWVLRQLGGEDIADLLVEGGGEVNGSFLDAGFAHRVAFFYAPKILGGRKSRKGIAGNGARRLEDLIRLSDIHWRKLGPDLLLSARVENVH